VHVGVALPQYESSLPGERPPRFATVARWAQRAEELGFDSVWLSDHVVFDLARYGGPGEPVHALEPLAALAALARCTTHVRLGTLVLCAALRPTSVLAKALATLDVLSGGRLDVGIGAGNYEPDFAAIGRSLPSPGARVMQLREMLVELTDLLAGGSVAASAPGVTGGVLDPRPHQQPRPPVFVGGRGDRVLRTAVELADGWNTVWVWAPEQYSERLAVVDAACDAFGRDPASFSRSLGLYALAGEDERDLHRRFDRLAADSPPGILDGVGLGQWRQGRLVGTVQQISEQCESWAALGVDTLVVNPGAAPFHAVALDDLEPIAAGMGLESRPGDSGDGG
jgi:alkanesulfonate monooxygenase SsuD/methylene tetrahydromethanopterin reductase-like flavin-dependent oxidoreductase (luciferase family)